MAASTVFVADKHALYREAAVLFLEAYDRFVVVGTAATAGETLAKAPALRPDVVLMDLSLPDRSGLEIIPVLRERLPGSRIVVLTMAEESAYRISALQAGADAYVSKPQAADELMPVLTALLPPSHLPVRAA